MIALTGSAFGEQKPKSIIIHLFQHIYYTLYLRLICFVMFTLSAYKSEAYVVNVRLSFEFPSLVQSIFEAPSKPASVTSSADQDVQASTSGCVCSGGVQRSSHGYSSTTLLW